MIFNWYLFQCKICGKVVKRSGGKTLQNEFTKHLASHAKETGDTFKCQECDFVRTKFMKRKHLFLCRMSSFILAGNGLGLQSKAACERSSWGWKSHGGMPYLWKENTRVMAKSDNQHCPCLRKCHFNILLKGFVKLVGSWVKHKMLFIKTNNLSFL